MAGRVERKVALVVGGGQTPGETIGNGRATAIVLAREGARVVVADRDVGSAEETVGLIEAEGGSASAVDADITDRPAVERMVDACVGRHGRLDLLHNNVGMSLAAGDAPADELDPDTFDRIVDVNLKGMWLTCRAAIPHMRSNGGGSIVNISSMAARSAYPYLGYKVTKVGVIGLTENLAIANAAHGIRVNTILPGLMNTPMAIEARVAAGMDRAEVVAQRDRQVPLGGKMGTAWDVAHAALFLHSDEARFVTGVSLPVDGGSGLR